MSALQVVAVLKAYTAEGNSLGELTASGTIETPAGPQEILPLTGGLRDVLRNLWDTHYDATVVPHTWQVTVSAERDGRQFEDVKLEDLPMAFDTAVFVVVQTLIEKAATALA